MRSARSGSGQTTPSVTTAGAIAVLPSPWQSGSIHKQWRFASLATTLCHRYLNPRRILRPGGGSRDGYRKSGCAVSFYFQRQLGLVAKRPRKFFFAVIFQHPRWIQSQASGPTFGSAQSRGARLSAAWSGC